MDLEKELLLYWYAEPDWSQITVIPLPSCLMHTNYPRLEIFDDGSVFSLEAVLNSGNLIHTLASFRYQDIVRKWIDENR